MSYLVPYRSHEGLGERVTGHRVYSWLPYVTDDTAYCLRVDYMDLGKPGSYPVVSVALAFDLDEDEVTLTVSSTDASHSSAATTIAEDATVTLHTTDLLYSVTVTRVASGATGTTTIRPILIQNNDVGHSDQTDPSGVVTYRCVYLYNSGAASITITDIDCDSGWKVSLEADSAETTQAIADEDSAPIGPVFAQNPNPAQALAAGEFVPLWIERSAKETAGEHTGQIKITYTYEADTYYSYLCGAYVTSDTDLTDYVVYIGYDEAGNGVTVDSHTPGNEEAVTLPATVNAAAIQEIVHGLGIDTFTMRLGVRRRMQTGAESQNQLLDYAIRLDYTSGNITAPNAPTIDSVEYLDGGQVRAIVSHDQSDCTTRARRLEATIGSETLTALLPFDSDETETEFIFQTPVTWGSSVTVSVVAVDVDGTGSAADTDTGTAYWVYDGALGDTLTAPITGAIATYADEYATAAYGDTDVTTSPGLAVIACDGALAFDARSAPAVRTRISALQLVGGAISAGSYADPVEPVSTTEFFLCAGGSRVAHVDLSANTLTCDRFDRENTIDCPMAGPTHEHNDVVYWQVFDVAANRWKTWMAVDKTNNCIRFVCNVECYST